MVMSGTASLRATAFWMPIAIASSAASASVAAAPNAPPLIAAMPWLTPGAPDSAATTSAATARITSAATPARSSTARSRPERLISAPPAAAPARNPARANSDADSENPGAPAMAKPTNTTLPVMLATKTRPSDRIDTASTTPLTAVRISSRAGSGPNPGSASRERARPC